MKIIIFVNEKREKISDNEQDVVVCKFQNIDLFNLIVLSVVAIVTQASFYILINSLDLIVDFEIKYREKFVFDFQTFIKSFLYLYK